MGIMQKITYYWARGIKKMSGAAIVNSKIGFDSKVEAGSQFVNSTMGNYSFCGYDCFINKTDIGSFVSIANYTEIGASEHPIDWVSTSPVFYNNRDSVKTKFSRHERKELPRTVIGNDVWIGHGSCIKAGVRVGDGAVIGMGSVVTKDVAPYSIVAGVPAKLIRMRFDEKTCSELGSTKWWTFEPKHLRFLSMYVLTPEKFIAECKRIKGEL